MQTPATSSLPRRTILTASALATASLGCARSEISGSDTIKIGLVGCGGRGSGAVINTLKADKGTKLYAVADVFEDKATVAASRIGANAIAKGRVDVTPERTFHGLDAYKKLLETDIDVVILATPPGFRPLHIEAAVEAGKHIFAEKPVAVDGPGVRQVLDACKKAKEKNLAVVSGLCWRYEQNTIELVDKIHNGYLGDITGIECQRFNGGVWVRGRQEGQSELEYQLRNWYYFTWLSGDFNVEQFVHEIDRCAWVMKDEPPVRCWGCGGRETRDSKDHGHIFDHMAVTFEYANGYRFHANAAQQKGVSGRNEVVAYGTKGQVNLGRFITQMHSGEMARHQKKAEQMHQAEQNAMYAALRKGEIINNGTYMAHSTLMGIMMRDACYTGKVIDWNKALNSQYRYAPSDLNTMTLSTKIEAPSVAIPGVTIIS
jgi:predicted dehydrogenase